MCKPAAHTKKDKRSCQSLAKLLFSQTLLTGPSIFSLSRLWTEPYSTECSVLRFHRDESYTCERASYGLVIRLSKGITTMLGKRKAHADKACSRFSRWKAFFLPVMLTSLFLGVGLGWELRDGRVKILGEWECERNACQSILSYNEDGLFHFIPLCAVPN